MFEHERWLEIAKREFDLPDLNDARLAIKQAGSVLKFVIKNAL